MKRLFAIVVALAAYSGLAEASIIFTLGNNPQPDEVNVLLNSGGTGTLVTGIAGASIVDFSSTQTLLEPSSGQARVSANPEGSPLTNISIALASGTFGDLIINPFLGGGCPTCVGGDATVTVSAVDSIGNPEPAVTFNYMIQNGNNFLTITTAAGERIATVGISVPGGFNDLRQPRISGLPGTVPEPGSFALMALALGLIAGIRKFRRV